MLAKHRPAPGTARGVDPGGLAALVLLVWRSAKTLLGCGPSRRWPRKAVVYQWEARKRQPLLRSRWAGNTPSNAPCAYQKPHTHGLRDRSRGPGPASDRQPKQGRRALSGSRRLVGVLRTFLRPPRQRARSSGAGHPWLRSGRLSMVAVVQAAHVRPRDDLARGRRLNGPTHRRI